MIALILAMDLSDRKERLKIEDSDENITNCIK